MIRACLQPPCYAHAHAIRAVVAAPALNPERLRVRS